MSWLITAYCICSLCCGEWADGVTKSGRQAIPGHTVACPPGNLGRPVWIDDVGLRVCDDTGGAIKGNRIDVLMHNHDEALEFGARRLEVTWLD